MSSLSQRMRKLQTKLLAIRTGPGAVALPEEVKRIHLRFAPKMNGGHLGARRFWKSELVRLKYHNPAVSMTIDRDFVQDDPATMSIHFAPENASQTSGSATASSASSEQTERVETINMKNYTNSEILDALVQLTKAQPVEPTPEELEEMASLEEQRRRSEKDSKLSQEVRARVKREQELLEQARGDVAAQTA